MAFFARLLPAETQALEKNLTKDLQDDIDLVTISIDNFLRSPSNERPRTWEQLLVQLRAVTLAVSAKASLIRIQSNMQKKLADTNETEAWLTSLLSEEEEEAGSSSPSEESASRPSLDPLLPPPEKKPEE